MTQLRDRNEIRRRLERDRPWAVYALGDLAPGYWEWSEWYGADEYRDALALIYRVGEWPILFTLGEGEAVRAVLAQLPPEPRLAASIRAEHLSAVESRWHLRRTNGMWRMLLAARAEVTVPDYPVMPLTPRDEPALRELFQDGRSAGEEPDFFLPEMLEEGTYFGIHEGAQWVAAAGTHLVAASEGVATIGNVYVRRDRRSAGRAAAVVAAVVAELQRREIRTIALNVRQENAAALRVYERLGFRRHCTFVEGLAELRQD